MFDPRLRSLSRLMISLTLAAGLAVLAGGAKAQDKRQNAPGEFDFYVPDVYEVKQPFPQGNQEYTPIISTCAGTGSSSSPASM